MATPVKRHLLGSEGATKRFKCPATSVVLASCNASFSTTGEISLQDAGRHGYVVFAPVIDDCFEVRLTALHDDAWPEKAGSYCLGIIHREDVAALRPSPGAEWDDLSSMHEGARLCAMSTGSFRFSETLFDTNAWRFFKGSLNESDVLVMSFERGHLRYRLVGHRDFTDVSSYASFLHQESTPVETGDPRATYVPFVWLFGEDDEEHQMKTLVQCSYPQIAKSDGLAQQLWNDSRFSDCSVECNGEVFRAHRAVLCTASPVFEAAFLGTMQEAKEARFEIRGCDSPAAVRALLEFLYMRRLADAEVDMLLHLLALAAQYEIEELTVIVVERLIHRVSAENVYAIFRAIRTFRDRRGLSGAYTCLQCVLKSRDDLLTALLDQVP